jgi:phosphotransferase system HPr (HPr) family protein
LIKNGKAVDAKSIIGVLSLGVSQGDEIEVICEGEYARKHQKL